MGPAKGDAQLPPCKLLDFAVTTAVSADKNRVVDQGWPLAEKLYRGMDDRLQAIRSQSPERPMTSRHTSTQDKQSLFQRILYSIFPGMLRERKEGEGYRGFFNTLILHFRPRTVPERTLHFTLTWGLGGMAFVLVSLLLGTGLLLKFYYAVHTAILPAFLIVLMAFHFWRV